MQKEYSYTITATVRKGDDVIQTIELANYLLDYENLVELETTVAASVMSALGALGQARIKAKKD